MFVFSMKTSKKKLLSYIFLFLIFIIGLVVFLARCSADSQVGAKVQKELLAQTNEQRIEYLKTFGWEVSAEAIEVRAVAIPQTFSDVYINYNKMQKEQGFDLTDYKGKLCSRYCYEIKNYPSEQKGIRANLLVYEGKIIGGDVCSLELSGFMHGFSLPKAS